MKVEWLRTTLKNLDDEARYIAKDTPQAAARFANAIKASVEQLSQCPSMGHDCRLPGTREWPLPDLPYVIPYLIRQGKLQVLRILHTRRLPPSMW